MRSSDLPTVTSDPWDVEMVTNIRAVKRSNIVLTVTLIAFNMRCWKHARGFWCLINSDRLRCAPRCVIRGKPGFSLNDCMELHIFGCYWNWCVHTPLYRLHLKPSCWKLSSLAYSFNRTDCSLITKVLRCRKRIGCFSATVMVCVKKIVNNSSFKLCPVESERAL